MQEALGIHIPSVGVQTHLLSTMLSLPGKSHSCFLCTLCASLKWLSCIWWCKIGEARNSQPSATQACGWGNQTAVNMWWIHRWVGSSHSFMNPSLSLISCKVSFGDRLIFDDWACWQVLFMKVCCSWADQG
jgi:hypothetical protein